jgi:hypothetical protein
MADDKIRISLDDLRNPKVDNKLHQQTVASTAHLEQLYGNSPISSAPIKSTPASPHPQMVWIIGGVLFLAMMAIIEFSIYLVSNSSQPQKSSQRESSDTTHIVSVLEQDATTNAGAQTVAEVVARMRVIELTGCPNDFRAVYLAHIHAWESMADVEREAIAFKAESEAGAVIVESFIRGFLGDPFGKANEITAAQNQLQRNYQAASKQVRESFRRVEEIAVAHGANLPKKQER